MLIDEFLDDTLGGAEIAAAGAQEERASEKDESRA
jgi:hypothetical protein